MFDEFNYYLDLWPLAAIIIVAGLIVLIASAFLEPGFLKTVVKFVAVMVITIGGICFVTNFGEYE